MRSRGGNLIRHYFQAAGLLVTALAVTSCGPSSGANAPGPTHVANVGNNVLQVAVGTANIYGDLGGAEPAGINVMTTYRQGSGNTAPGDSGAAVDSPTFTLPNALTAPAGTPVGAPDGTQTDNTTIFTGPAPAEEDTNAMTSTSQTVGATNATTFGISGQVSGLGFEPFNYGNLGSPDMGAPYPVPVYDPAGDANQLPAAWGGPPAFDLLHNGESPVGNGDVPGGTAGISMGLDVFDAVTPVAGGTYSLTVSLPANTGTVSSTKSFSLPSPYTVLPAFTPPVPTADASGDGGATFAYTLPAGVTEAYIEIVDFGPGPFGAGATASASCNGSKAAAPVYYTIEVTASGTATLGPAAGPGGAPSLCTVAQNTAANSGTATSSDLFTVQGIGFDYPAYEASYPNSSGNPSPAILGGNGEDDITISSSPAFQTTTDALHRVAHPPMSVLRTHQMLRHR